MSRRELERKQFHLTKEQIEWLSLYANETGMSGAEIVRRAIDEYRAKPEVKAKHEQQSKK